MTNEQKKQELVDRVDLAVTKSDNDSFAIADNYKTKQETQKRKKCSECGKGFLGQDGAMTCGSACRMKRSRKK